jgi:hypothetical protein
MADSQKLNARQKRERKATRKELRRYCGVKVAPGIWVFPYIHCGEKYDFFAPSPLVAIFEAIFKKDQNSRKDMTAPPDHSI